MVCHISSGWFCRCGNLCHCGNQTKFFQYLGEIPSGPITISSISSIIEHTRASQVGQSSFFLFWGFLRYRYLSWF